MDIEKKSTSERRTPLTRDRIIHAALALSDKKGLSALTMRKLAKALKVEAMSLYHHFANKDEIFDGMVDVVFAEIGPASFTINWKTSMKDRAISVRETLTKHPWALGVMESRINPGEALPTHHNSVLGVLREAGFSVELAAHAFAVIDAFIFGFILQEQNLPFETPEELTDIAESTLETMPTDKYPYLAEMIVEHALKPEYSYEKEFEYGLDLILDGLERILDKEKRR